MKLYTLILPSLVSLTSCAQDKKTNQEKVRFVRDTIVVKQRNVLNKSYEVGFYSKSYTYNWISGTDTLDFVISATEHEKDSTLHLDIYHDKPILFTAVLSNINECFPLIKEDFDITKFSSLYFKSPINYLDLAKELSSEYEQKFGRKSISYESLNQFLLKSALNTQLENFLIPFNKGVKGYSIEKFQIMEKKYYSSYFSDVDFAEYPEFTIDGMGVYVHLDNK